MGIYVFKYDRLEELLAEDPTWVDFGREVIPAAIKVGNVQAFVFDGYWGDIGTISAFYRANWISLPRFPSSICSILKPPFTRGRVTCRLQKSPSRRFAIRS